MPRLQHAEAAGLSDEEWLRRFRRDLRNAAWRVARRDKIPYRKAKAMLMRGLRLAVAARREAPRPTVSWSEAFPDLTETPPE